MTVAGQPQVAYTYDTGNRVTQIAQGSSVVQLGYDADGRRTSLTLPNGVIASYSYNADSQLTGITYTQAGSVLGDLAYTYDSAGRVATVGGSLAHTTLPPAVASASYNADNQLTQWGGTTTMYDPNGNLTNDGAHTYSWNSRNLLASIDGGSTASFVYGPFGRRISKTVYGTTTGYLYDGPNVVQELSGSMPSANLLEDGLDNIFTRTDSTGTYSFMRDLLGSTLELTGVSGTVEQQYTYDPYGNTSTTGNASGSSYQYTGRENDGDGLYYYRARYYSTELARFVSEDPMGILGGSANLYRYVRDNPTSRIDPLGLWEVTLGGGAELGGLIKFGKNCGEWNFGLYAGAGEGAFGSYDPTDSGYHEPGFDGGLAASSDVGIGKIHIGVDAEVGVDGSGSSSVTIPFPGGGALTIPLPPSPGPSGSPHGTLGAGAGGAAGVGGTTYFGGNPSCGCGS
jgi:RHS repeat-associated protein